MTNQELSALIKKNPISFGCGLAAVLLAGAIYWRSDAIPDQEKTLAEKSGLGEKLALNLTNSALLKEQVDDLGAANKAIESRLIRASALLTNTQYFYKLERELGVKLIEARQTTPPTVAKPAKGLYLPIAFSVSVQGTLPQLLTFLQSLESGAHYCRVNSATFSGHAVQRNAPLTMALNVEMLGMP